VLAVPSLECDFFEVTGPSGGESYKRIPVREGDIILGDRGYCRAEGLAHVADAGGDVVVRLHGSALPLLDEEGAAFDPLPALRTLKGHEPGEWPVAFTVDGEVYRARLCAVRKSEAAAERARRHIRRAARKQKQVRPSTLEMAEYMVVLTTLSPDTDTAAVLELYRARWQIELAFKRLKSLFGVGHVPKYDETSARAWLHGKLLAVLVIERLSEEARLFSPWGFELAAAKPLARVHRSAGLLAGGGVAALPAKRAAAGRPAARRAAPRATTKASGPAKPMAAAEAEVS
jgi:hypothetical protein